jgi:DNA-binding transcriptional MerR regulator
MPIKINDKTYFLIHEVMKEVKITATTYYRWVRQGKIKDVEKKDRRGWRLFTEADIQRVRAFKNKTVPIE